ncbi:MAG: TauD/TfdA family dioxygenase [Streptosporangiaceae bacterium]
MTSTQPGFGTTASARPAATRRAVSGSSAPAEPGAVADVVASFGYVRETNYGRPCSVRVEASAANRAFTSLPIGPHTDNPYRDPVPTVQLLHCLTSCADGGESGLLDGFRAAAQLRATRPMIGLNPAGLIREVRYNSRSMEPVRPRSGASPAEAADQMREFYLAYRAFAAILLRPSLTVRFMLRPGDCVVFDNTRILHSRTGFGPAGRRHLQGCYADIDAAESTVAVLARNCDRQATST